MWFLPLIWAALRRKPVRSLVIFLSVTVAFTLFGLMIGLNATLDLMEARARADRIWVWPRFDGIPMPVAVARQVAQLRGVKGVTVTSYLNGYVGDPKNQVFMAFFDDQYGDIFPDWGPTPAQWEMMRHDHNAILMSAKQAEHWHKKAGDTFTIIVPQVARADGTHSWTFQLRDIGQDVSQIPTGYIVGSYDRYDKALPLADQGKIGEVDVLAADAVQASALAQRIDRLFANSPNPTQAQTEKSVYAISNNYGGMDVRILTHDIALMGLLMILFMTANVIAQSVRERLPEFATLKTFGFSDAMVIGLVAGEAALLCLAGAACGVALAAFLAHQLPNLLPPNLGLPSPTMSPALLVWALASASAMALASTLLPALRLARLDIAAVLSRRA